MAHTVNPTDDFHPDCPAPTPQQEDPCEGDIQLSGKLVYHCCCPRLYTRTFILKLGPQTEPQLMTTAQGTVNAWEAGGYLVLAHSLTDLGSEWLFNLTIGWYGP